MGLSASACLLTPFSQTAFAGPQGGGGSISDIAEREMIRRLQRVKEADEDIIEGKRLEAEKDYEGARQRYKTALDKIPRAPLVAAKRAEATKLFADVSVKLADQRASEGRRDEARKLLEAVLTDEIDPYNKQAKKILVRLDDPEWYNHALTPRHVENVAEVERLLKVAKGYYDLGDFDNAEKQYDSVLRIDRYNMAARRGQQEVEFARREYLQSARDHTRSRLLRKVDEAWETPVPVIAMTGLPDGTGGDPGATGREYLARKLRETILPSINFDEATVDEAIEYLRQKSKEYDPFETDESKKGVNIVRRQGGPGPDGAPAPAEEQTISLRLSNVPLAEALRYVAEGAGMKYKVEPYTVVVVPLWAGTSDMYTRTFRVPPDFLSTAGGAGGGGGDVVDDPFATDGGATSDLKPRQTAKEVLMSHGITFPEGASAFFSPRTSTLVVRNTQSNMELIETLVDELRKSVQNQVFITTKFVEVTQGNLDELGFDWMLGQFNAPGSNRVFASGGTVGNQRDGAIDSANYAFVPPGGTNPVPVGQFPVTSGLRFGLDGLQANAIDAMLDGELLSAISPVSPGIFAIAGVLTDPQFQVVIRALNQKKGSDLMTAPSVVTRSGQRAKIEIIREFIYPTEYDPPEIPQNFGNQGNNNGGGGGIPGFGGGGQVQSFPVTPANPTAFEMRPVGVTLEVDPVVGADGLTIELNIAPEVVEFEGFINYGSPIQTAAIDGLGRPTTVVLTENRIEQPVFATRKLTTAVTIWDGQTVAIGGLIREDVQQVEDKVPFFGDVPLIGRLFRTQSEVHFKRNLIIFVTATLIDPAGIPTRPQASDADPVAGAGIRPPMAGGGMPGAGGGPSDGLFPQP